MGIFEVFDRISANSQAQRGKIEYVIAGLGNFGMEYDNTRHNAGFFTVDKLAGIQDLEALVPVFFVKLLQAVVLRGKAAAGGGVDYKQDLALVIRKGYIHAFRVLHYEIVYRHLKLLSDLSGQFPLP